MPGAGRPVCCSNINTVLSAYSSRFSIVMVMMYNDGDGECRLGFLTNWNVAVRFCELAFAPNTDD